MPNRLPVLRQYAASIWKNRGSGSDNIQVVAANAPVRLFAQGATVCEPFDSLPIDDDGERTVYVYHVGAAVVGGMLGVNGDNTLSLGVVAVSDASADAPWIKVHNVTGDPITLTLGCRLHVVAPAIAFYSDALGTVSLGNTLYASAESGGVLGYVPDLRFDVFVDGVPDAPRTFIDQVGSFVLR